MRNLYDNNKLSLGNCYNKDFHQSAISTLRIDEFNCSVCELQPCGGDPELYTCVETDKHSHAYECRETKPRRVPLNFSTRLSASTSGGDSGLSLNFRLVLWISVSVCIVVLGFVCTLVIWLYYHRKRRRKFNITTGDEATLPYKEIALPYKEVVVTKASSRSSVYLTMMSPTKVKDTDVLLSSPWFAGVLVMGFIFIPGRCSFFFMGRLLKILIFLYVSFIEKFPFFSMYHILENTYFLYLEFIEHFNFMEIITSFCELFSVRFEKNGFKFFKKKS